MLSLIGAMDLARNIGYQGNMPWGRDMKGDLKYFKEMTEGKSIIMGRKTFDSLPNILPHRKHIVLSRSDVFPRHPFIWWMRSVDEIVELVKEEEEEVFVIGGAQIYKEFMPYADRIYLTKIHELFEGDTKFPSITGKWNMTYSPKIIREGDKYPSEYITFERAE